MVHDDEAGGKKRLAGMLGKRFFLRFHLSLILGFSFAVGLLATKLLLLAGLESLLIRWSLAVLFAYAGFLIGVRVWLAYIGLGRQFGDGDNGFDFPNADFSGSGSSNGSTGASFVPEFSTGGGGFGGGGASGDFVGAGVVDGGNVSLSGASSGIKLPDVDIDLDVGGGDDGCLAVLLLMVIAAVLLAVFGIGFYLVWQAPSLLAEAAFEAALAAGLIKSTRRITDPGWVGGAMKASWLPLLGIMALTALLAFIVETFVPEARTLLEAVRMLAAAA